MLRQFLAVADAGTLRAAAQALNMSQPPLTAAIRQLEDRLGVRLFERSVKGMALTEAGTALAEDARQVFGQLERAETRACALGNVPKRLRIGFVSAALNSALPTLLHGLNRAGRATPRLSEMSTPEQLEALTCGKIDVGLLHPPVPRLAGLAMHSLGMDPFWAAIPANHPLAGNQTLRFRDIAGEPLVLFPRDQGPVLYEKISGLAHKFAGRFNVVAETRRVHSQLAIVSSGLGVGLVTQSTAGTLSVRGVETIPLSDVSNDLYLELGFMCDDALARSLLPMVTT